MHTNRVRRTLTTTTTAASILLATMIGTPLAASAVTRGVQVAAAPCGWYPTNHDPSGTTSRYRHCADTFIMIRVHWSNGASHRLCVEPWENIPFWRDGRHIVTNAYYIPDRPRVITTPEGKSYCAASQLAT